MRCRPFGALAAASFGPAGPADAALVGAPPLPAVAASPAAAAAAPALIPAALASQPEAAGPRLRQALRMLEPPSEARKSRR
mmetsp:Transcript_108808/g.346989  ORF Transcript_108808/g.346989 Transcript_108808/m.346989 type:complete len:81 (-) Transcript_108808:147-389(-)